MILMFFGWILSFFSYQNYKNGDTKIWVPTCENPEVLTTPQYVWTLFCSQLCSPALRVVLMKMVGNVKVSTVPSWYSIADISLLDVFASWGGICCCQIDLGAITEISAAPKRRSKFHCCKINNRNNVFFSWLLGFPCLLEGFRWIHTASVCFFSELWGLLKPIWLIGCSHRDGSDQCKHHAPIMDLPRGHPIIDSPVHINIQ